MSKFGKKNIQNNEHVCMRIFVFSDKFFFLLIVISEIPICAFHYCSKLVKGMK